ncbi:MAG: trypsin-like peptidase domain-containing protein [Candidatus Nomurabacteria bacterium]|jgi:serine protease Do|nr:trypsin-like peptidase domain-containing protein [Candidatus Nomurabacteria bacterium]
MENNKQSNSEPACVVAARDKQAIVPKKHHGKLNFLIGLVVVTFVVSLSGLGLSVYSAIRANQSFNKAASISTVPDGNFASVGADSIDSVVKKVSPSVVSIVTTTRSSSMYSYLYEGYGQAAGTGMIVSADGYVLTNKHVIEDAKGLKVITDDGTTYDDVDIVASDPVNDVAFLKIKNVKGLSPIEIGNSSTISVGQSVVAIGNALGQYQNTVTSGIISGRGRTISAATNNGSMETLTDLIQTDTAINPGNSGGPLVNVKGQVIGINTAIVDDAQGIGFAIPINSIKGMLSSLQKDGSAKRAFLGVNYVSLTPDVAKELNVSVNQGAYVYVKSGTAISKGGPADKAGIKDKDIITKVGDQEVGPGGSVGNLIAEYSAGDEVELTLLRGDKEVTVKVTLGEYPE